MTNQLKDLKTRRAWVAKWLRRTAELIAEVSGRADEPKFDILPLVLDAAIRLLNVLFDEWDAVDCRIKEAESQKEDKDDRN